MQKALRQMRESCAQKMLADRAFFRFPRGGKNVTGASIHLARELARSWGNIDHGIVELSRDDERAVSEMLAYAWDMESNVRASSTFQVPHTRDKNNGTQEQLTASRDVYENNANQGARRLREAIFAVLPTWYIEEAKELCNKTIREGGGEPLAHRVATAIEMFNRLGVSTERVERSMSDGAGKPSGQWDEHDVARLGIIFTSIRNGEASVDDEFPVARIGVEELTAQAGKATRAPRQQARQVPADVEVPRGDPGDVDPTTDPLWGQGDPS
jgi:hypothetical protein